MKTIGGLLLLFLMLAVPAYAADEVNKNSDGIAINGYDPVAYFIENEAIAGKPEHSHQWLGATWYFKNAQNMHLFSVRPSDYAPQYGGFCAYAMASGQRADIDPAAWSLQDNKLYLNYNQQVMNLWRQDTETHIQNADRHWKGI